jgi:predicted Zn-dependent protease
MRNLFKKIVACTIIINFIVLANLYSFVKEIYKTKEYPNHIHTTIYIDRNFDDFEQTCIINAAEEWVSTTNHIIEYDILQLPDNDINYDEALIIYKVTPDHPMIVILDTRNNGDTLGFYDRKSIIPSIALVSERISNEDYTATIMHELGHSLGLVHSKEAGTLMYPSRNFMFNGIILTIASDHITFEDGQKFCELYHCDPKQLKYQEEPFHF